MTLSDRIAVLNSGSLQQIDPPLTCYNEPDNLFVAGFIGSPSMNFVEATIHENSIESKNFSLAFDPASIDGIGVGDEVTIGIRPEDIYPGQFRDEIADPSALIDATTDILEPMGDEIFAYMLLGEGETSMSQEQATNDQLLMSISPDSEITEDEDIQVAIDRRNVHLFDTATGDAITHSLEPTLTSGSATSEAESDD